jgi:hypothetical protein
MVKAKKGGLLHNSFAVGRGRVSTQLIFSHLCSADMNCRFKYIKELGVGDKVMYS